MRLKTLSSGWVMQMSTPLLLPCHLPHHLLNILHHPPPEGDSAMSEPDVPDVPLTRAVENETFVRSEAKKKATRAPRMRRVQLRKRGTNAS